MTNRHRWLLILTLLFGLLPGVSTARATSDPESQLYIAHFARFTAQIPADWTVNPFWTFDYIGPDGFVGNVPLAGASLDEVCANISAPESEFTDATVRVSTLAGQPACRVDARYQGAAVAMIATAHPYPFEALGEHYAFAGLIADPAHIDEIAETVSFDPERVTPEAYLSSVIDLAEARAYWSSDVDWNAVRADLLEWLDITPTMNLATGLVSEVISSLRAVGDNHSFIVRADQPNFLTDSEGFGLILGGARVLLVYDDSSAKRAGIRPGDVVMTVNDEPFRPTPGLNMDQRSWPSPTTLTLQRPGSAESISVTIERGPFRNYVNPSGRRLDGGIGYLDIPLFRIPGREAEFTATASDLIATIDKSPTCGWVIDLRLNMGGSYSPMVTAVGPILGNGTFVGWRQSDGQQTWVTYEDGRITDDGRLVSNYLDGNLYALQEPMPPVAVLTSSTTSSSGEVTTLAFLGRADVRLFGEETGGYTTANAGTTLFEGTRIALAVAAMTDRSGATHLDGIAPDEHVAIDWSTYGTEDDPVINAAVAWLNQQPACSGAVTAVP